MLVEGGDADRIVVVAVDDVGSRDASPRGWSLRRAVAVLLGSGMTEGSAHVCRLAVSIRRGAPDAEVAVHGAGHKGPAPAPPAGAAAVHRVRVAAASSRGSRSTGFDRSTPSLIPGLDEVGNLTTGTERSPQGAALAEPAGQVRRSSQAVTLLLMLCTREGDGAWPWLPPRLQ